MIIFIFLKKIILNLIIFLSFFGITNFAKSEQEKFLDNQVYVNKNISDNKTELISENNNKIINYIIKIPDQINNYTEIEEKKDIKYYFVKIIDKMSELFDDLVSGFLGVIGGYFAQKVINKVSQEPKKII